MAWFTCAHTVDAFEVSGHSIPHLNGRLILFHPQSQFQFHKAVDANFLWMKKQNSLNPWEASTRMGNFKEILKTFTFCAGGGGGVGECGCDLCTCLCGPSVGPQILGLLSLDDAKSVGRSGWTPRGEGECPARFRGMRSPQPVKPGLAQKRPFPETPGMAAAQPSTFLWTEMPAL